MEKEKNARAYAVVMAGGKGERFWPQSRLSNPKQLLRLLGNLTLIEQTIERLSAIFDYSHIIVVTNTNYVAPMRSLLSYLPQENIIGEPEGKDTAPCIANAAAYIKNTSRVPDPVLCLFPTDHIINDTVSFYDALADSLAVAEDTHHIVTIGIKPNAPMTGYGYIEVGDKMNFTSKTVFRKVCGFKEKPSLELSEAYVADGKHMWNSGIFILNLSSLLTALKEFAPDMYRFYEAVSAFYASHAPESRLTELYNTAPEISIDYAVMEKSDNIVTAEAAFDWDDVGSWTSMRNQILPEKNNNVVRGLHAGLDTSDCIIIGNSNHLIATVDVKDLVIVATEDATLVCNAKSAQRIIELVKLIAGQPDLAKFV